MKRLSRQRRYGHYRRNARLLIFASGGFVTVVLLVLGLMWLEKYSSGKNFFRLKSQEDLLNIPAERSGKLIFYDALKEPNPGESEWMSFAPTSPASESSGEEQALSMTRPSRATGKNKTYTIQVAASKEKDAAQRLVNLLIKKGHPAYLVSENIPGKGLWYRVRIGHYHDLKDAEKVSDRILQKERLKGFVTVETKTIN